MKKLILGILFLLISNFSFGQFILPNYQVQREKKGTLFLRWEPRSPEEWLQSIENGYKLEVFEAKEGEEWVSKDKKKLNIASSEEWEIAKIELDTFLLQFYQGAQDLIFMGDELKAEIGKSIMPEEGLSQEQNVEAFRLGFLMYAATYDFKIVELAGVGYRFPFDEQKNYKIIVSTEGFKPYEFVKQKGKAIAPKVPVLEAKFGNLKSNFKWNTRDYRNDFFGYHLESSIDGKVYTPLTEVPMVNLHDTIQSQPELHFLEKEIALNKNYKNYWFRLKGMDYFGFKSERSSVIMGYGFEELLINPTITMANQTDSNYAYLSWKLDTKYNRLIEEFKVLRADSIKGIYQPVLEDLPAETREALIKMDTTKNYYRVVYQPKNGEEVSSFPVFVMGMDTIPPIIPIGFEGEIDSMGIVTLSWSANTEKDLWGYKVFYSDFIDDEFSNITPSPTLDTIYVDTVNLKTTNEYIYYKIIALDKRNNRSPFTTILSIKKPDIIPPVTPVFREVKFEEDSIRVHWDNSSSKDVSRHQLFRKIVNLENSWTLIAEFDTLGRTDIYIDKDFQLNQTFAYLLIAIDDDGLQSKPSTPRLVETKSIKPKNAFDDINVEINEELKQAIITWQLKEPDKISEIMVYRGKSKEDISLYKIIDPVPNFFIEEKINPDKKLYFYLSPSYKEGDLARFSKLIEIGN